MIRPKWTLVQFGMYIFNWINAAILAQLCVGVFLTPSTPMFDLFIERPEVLKMNTKYISRWDVHTRRANRSSPYSLNLNTTFVQPMYNNITIKIIVNEKHWSGYKLLSVLTNDKLCDFVKNDQVVYPLLRKYGNAPAQCPIYGNFWVRDLVVKPEDLSPLAMFSAYSAVHLFSNADIRLDFQITLTDTSEAILLANLYMKLVDRATNVKKKPTTAIQKNIK